MDGTTPDMVGLDPAICATKVPPATASSVDPQLLNGDQQQLSTADGVAGVAEAWHQAVIAVGNTIRAQATIMGYADCFGLLGVVLLAAILPVVLLRKAPAGQHIGAGQLTFTRVVRIRSDRA